MKTIKDYIRKKGTKFVLLATIFWGIFFIALTSVYITSINKPAPASPNAIETASNQATAAQTLEVADVHIFFHPKCAYCHLQFDFFEEINIKEKFPHLNFIRHDVSQKSKSNLLQFYGRSLGVDMRSIGTPFLVYGDKYIMGFDAPETTGQEILELLKSTPAAKTAPAKVNFKQSE